MKRPPRRLRRSRGMFRCMRALGVATSMGRRWRRSRGTFMGNGVIRIVVVASADVLIAVGLRVILREG